MPAVAAIFLVLALAAGSRSRWRTQADVADEEDRAKKAGSPTVQGTPGVARVFFWYGLTPDNKVTADGPYRMTDQEAFQMEFRVKQRNLGAQLFRFVWPGHGVWLYDQRTDPALLASRDLPTGQSIAGDDADHQDDVGVIPVRPPVTGAWPFTGFPSSVSLNGKLYRKAKWAWRHHPSIIAQYRENSKTNAEHLHVLRDGTYRVDHKDEANPDEGAIVEHLMRDVLARRG